MTSNEYKEQARIFSANLNKYMRMKGINQNDLSILMGISNASAHYWMEGIKIPRMDKIQFLADYFNIRISDLLEENANEEVFFTKKDLMIAIFGEEVSDNLLQEVLKYAKYLKDNEGR